MTLSRKLPLIKSLCLLVLIQIQAGAATGSTLQCKSIFSLKEDLRQKTKPEDLENLHLQTENFEIRPPRNESELNDILNIYLSKTIELQSRSASTKEQFIESFDISQNTLHEARLALNAPHQLMSLFKLGVFKNGHVIGGITFHENDPGVIKILSQQSPHISRHEKWVSQGIALHPQHQQSGYGSEITQRRLAFIFDSLGADGVIVNIHSANHASIALSSKFGFKRLKVKFLDKDPVDFYYLRKEDWLQQQVRL